MGKGSVYRILKACYSHTPTWGCSIHSQKTGTSRLCPSEGQGQCHPQTEGPSALPPLPETVPPQRSLGLPWGSLAPTGPPCLPRHSAPLQGQGASGPFLGCPLSPQKNPGQWFSSFLSKQWDWTCSLHRGPEAMAWRRTELLWGRGAHLRPRTPTPRRCFPKICKGLSQGHTQVWNPAGDRLPVPRPQLPPQLAAGTGRRLGPQSRPSPSRSAALCGQTADVGSHGTPLPLPPGPAQHPLRWPDSSLLHVRAQTPPLPSSPLWKLPDPSVLPPPQQGQRPETRDAHLCRRST